MSRFLEQHRFITDHQRLEKGTKSGHDGLQPSLFEEPQLVYQAHLSGLPGIARQRHTQTQLAEDSVENNKPRFIDLFAGIGGIRMGFEAHGGKCVFTSEWNRFSRKTCLANFPQTPDHVFVGDITKVNGQDIPDHEILPTGFPCQPFSIAGVSKKNALGRPHGFACTTQCTLFLM